MTEGSPPGPGPIGTDTLRPDPLLALGLIANRTASLEDGGRERVRAEVGRLVAALQRESERIAVANPDLFSGAPARIRVVSHLGVGASLAMAEAAREAGAEVRAVLPYGPDLCRAELGTDEARATLDRLLAGDADPFVLDGAPGSVQANERADALVLDGSDILVAFWDGEPDGGRAGIAALVQEAVDRRVPVIVLPAAAGGEAGLIDDPDALLLPAVAADLPRVAFAANVDRVMARAFAPPASPHEKEAIRDCLGEARRSRSRRFEYRILLKLARRRPRDPNAIGPDEEWRRARASASLVSPGAAAAVDRLHQLADRMDEVAGFYGEQVRSGIVMRYLLAAIGSLLLAVFALLAPDFGLAWLVIQAAISTATIVEARAAGKRRWNERWLDYRSLAERFRCDRFLLPIGIATVRLDTQTSAEDPAWMRWCHRRLLRATWIGGTIGAEVVAHATRHLVEVEIPGQTGYHEGAALRARSLARRLQQIGSGAVLTTLAACLVILATQAIELPDLLTAVIQAGLLVLSAVYLAASGLKAEAGFDIAAARSEGALAALGAICQRVEALPQNFERLTVASRAAASAMILDTMDWRVGVQRSRQPYRATPPAAGPKAR